MVDYGSTWTINIKGALRHLWEDRIERVSTASLDILKLITKNLGTIGKKIALKIPIDYEDVENNVDKVHEVTENKLSSPATMAAIEVLSVKMNISNLVIPKLMERNHILKVLNQSCDSVVMSKLVHQIGKIKGYGLEKQEVGDPLVVRVVNDLCVPADGSNTRVSNRLLIVRKAKSLGDVTV